VTLKVHGDTNQEAERKGRLGAYLMAKHISPCPTLQTFFDHLQTTGNSDSHVQSQLQTADFKRRPTFLPQPSINPNHQESSPDGPPLPPNLDGGNINATIPVDADPVTMNQQIESIGQLHIMITKEDGAVLTQAQCNCNMVMF
jgi:hypothetical protein